MSDLIISPSTQSQLEDYLSNPGQSLGLVGESWLNKADLADQAAARLLEINKDELANYPYILKLGGQDLKSIGIDEVRQINGFIALKVPSKKLINRIIVIINAHLMTVEAQNALLKNLEEPPAGTVFILTASSTRSLLPTIVSRLHIIQVYKPFKQTVVDHFVAKGHEQTEVQQAYMIAGGLPALIDLILSSDDHPLSEAANSARSLLSSITFDRLNQVNELAKDKHQLKNVLFIIKQMALTGLNSENQAQAQKWHRILSACLDTEVKLDNNAQTKLTLTNFMLSIA